MESQRPDDEYAQDRAESVRQTIHDIAATIISIRALAETLADHVPLLIAICRSRKVLRDPGIPTAILDSLPSLPTEIIKLCELANENVRALGPERGLREGASQPSPRSRAMPEGAELSRQGNGQRVLLVEDEETVRYVLSETLREQGYSVTSARDGDEAMQLFQSSPFDLVLMDLRIPGMSGLETAKKLRDKEISGDRHTPIIGLTASPLLEDRERATAAGMDEVIIKPVDDRELQSVLARYI
jgi:CheY-like chemotaxis protein